MASDKDSSESKGRRSFNLDTLLNLSGRASQTFSKAVGQSGNLLDILLKAPEYMEHIGKAGRYLKDMREVAGLTIDDLSGAVDLDNPDILRAIEEGRSPITLDILFRLASFYSRNDPISFMVNFSREYAPWLWQVLRITGVEKLLITLERELKFINIYRSRALARNLSDENFEKMLGFVRGSFDMAMDFIEPFDRPDKSDEKEKTEAPKSDTNRTSGRATNKQTTKKTPPREPASKPAARSATSPKKAAPRKAPQKKPAAQATKASGRTTKKEG